ncbi:phiSA1p31-related protein [Kitasatospora sp. NPDC101183]|uniref:phiSA1p31-related protein n=1 Tax=Kitasatospora sp. NPDC101183 TaxID=3364100 RepID=UPI0038260DD3
MTQEFKVGDKVTHRIFGDGEVRLGPYSSVFAGTDPGYTVEITTGSLAGRVGHCRAADLTLRPDFEHGATVLVDGERCTVTAGPFRDRYEADRPWYVVENPDGSHETSAARHMTLAPTVDTSVKVGDRVRVLEAMHAEEQHGKLGRITDTDAAWTPHNGEVHPYRVALDGGGFILARRVERVGDAPETYTYRGVVYDLTAAYRDQDGDVWRLSVDERHPNGSPLAALRVSGFHPHGSSLAGVVNQYGPLTRVTD